MKTVEVTRDHASVVLSDYDFSNTWMEHGGLTGHIDYQERVVKRKESILTILKALKGVVETPNGQTSAVRFFQLKQAMFNILIGKKVKLVELLDQKPYLKMSMISGQSRSGGTYSLAEMAKLYGDDIQQTDIRLSHDFYPMFSWRWFRDEESVLDDMADYLASIILATDLGQKRHYKRTIVGGMAVPRLIAMVAEHFDGIDFDWVHPIRDFPSTCRSFNSYTKGSSDNIDANQFYTSVGYNDTKTLSPVYLAMLCWFINNLFALPSGDELPFLSRRIYLTNQRADDILSQIRRAVDHHIKKYPQVSYSMVRPVVLKFGEAIPEYFQERHRERGSDPAIVSKFNVKPLAVLEDEQAVTFYESLCQLCRQLYEHHQLEFPL